jgi:hypothetical protein
MTAIKNKKIINKILQENALQKHLLEVAKIL